ncbi:MAG: TetR/AcrR family transcriptional regulator [Planctomycetes bacterium]|nr:TetR/AcrR family transcriptional regulator [Planctomycetota bacterium]
MTRLPAAKRREQLLDSAADLFATHGYARATTSQLARAAGVTEPIIYRHFDSKRALFVALIERTGEDTLREWEADLADAADPAERLRRLIGDNPMVKPGGKGAYRVILQAITEVDDPQIQAALRNHISKLHRFVADEIRLAQQSHKVTRRFTAELIAWLLIDVGLGYGVLSAWGIDGHGRDEAGVHVQSVIARLVVGPENRPDEG